MRPSRNQALIDALGVEVKVRRQELAFTQEDLAGRCDLDRPFISLIEVGKKQPSLSVLHRIASALDLKFGEFCDRIDARYRKALKSSERIRRSQP
ncbi:MULTISPECIES: helix-turn-helix transcriptional regulator [unclassified Methylibium]|uniref:helix-turn-helix domain-containing protein n=1 Tax=unclassified Methylibium TaxID=2633235 RepID=UPI0003F3F11C|nr:MULTISPECIES: helix-turn-helix transcriptional regulator [unclassified Methylibium]EWS54902.1 anaerobic benzoate catabolism transcriptional regulator [Methylibium sp. T29]EWS61743.1 anaerobic benzoate catabolism transcriptional regulator [Methylibium sp. T29-B]